MSPGTLGISDDHLALHHVVRRWVAHHADLVASRTALDAPEEQLPGFWPALAAQGWLGLAVPHDRGGEGFGVAELAVVCEELGRTVAPGPFLPTALGAMAVDRYGGDELRHAYLPKICAGELPVAVSLGSDTLTVSGEADDESPPRLSGALDAVLGGPCAELFVVPVSGAGDRRWVVLERGEVAVSEVPSVDPTRRLARMEVGDVEIATTRWLRPAHGQLDIADLVAVLLSAEAVGMMSWCVETAAAYAVERVQFGRPIGQFQAVKHRCADMLCTLEHARAAAWDAARGGDDRASMLAVGAAAAIVPAAAFEVAKDCIQVLGGIGFTWEHDAHLFLRRATATRQLLGGAAPWRARVGGLACEGVRRSLSFDLPAAADRYRSSVRSFVDLVRSQPTEQWNATVAEAGYLVPHWPEPWGLGADALHQLVIDEELAAAGIRRPHLAVGMWVLPTLIAHGTAHQQERFIGPTMALGLTWCQLFSEPGAGSDLASLRTRAQRVEGGWRLTGQKVWTTLAHQADWGICLARTDPDRPRHDGITCFLVDMASGGIDIRPLRELTGQELFNEVFLDEVFVPDDCVVGEVDGGWSAARTTLANERVSMGGGSSFGPGAEAVVAMVASDPGLAGDARVVDELGALVAGGHAIAVLGMRLTLQALSGHDAGAEASVKKLLGVEHEQRTQEMGLGLLGPAGAVLEGDGRRWVDGFLGNRALSIAGGTSEVQRNVIAERLLGLPKDP